MSLHNEYACCVEGCSHIICFTPAVEERMRRTHEWWQCPAGHNQHFAGKTEQEKRVDRLMAENSQLRLAVMQLTYQLAVDHRCWCGASFDTSRQLSGHRMGADHWTHRSLRAAS